MIRRIISLVALVGLSLTALHAQEIATFTLSEGTTVSGKPLVLSHGRVFFEATSGVVDISLDQFDASAQAAIGTALGFPPGSDLKRPVTTVVDGAAVFNNDGGYASWTDFDENGRKVASHAGKILRYESGGRLWLYQNETNQLVAIDVQRSENIQPIIASRLKIAGMSEEASRIEAALTALKKEKLARLAEQRRQAQPPVQSSPRASAPSGPGAQQRTVKSQVDPRRWAGHGPTSNPKPPLDPLYVAMIILGGLFPGFLGLFAWLFGRALRDGM